MVVWMLVVGCASKDPDHRFDAPDDTRDVVQEGAVTVETYSDRSDRNGLLDIPFAVNEPDEVVQIVVKTKKYASTEFLVDPDDTLVLSWKEEYYAKESLTEAFYPTEFATTLNWPVRAEDAPLTTGMWLLSIATLTSQGDYNDKQDVEVTILRRTDPDFARGDLHVLLAYAGDLAGDPDLVAATEAAVVHWTDIYAARGVALTVSYTSIDVDPDLPDTYAGQDEYEALLADQPARTLLMVMGDTIAGDTLLFGEAGGIPGPYAATPAAAVEVSWLAHAGTNGRFSEDEILVLGETMAHETGHYLGLFHPVEVPYSGDDFEYFDALSDTPRCDSYGECEGALGDNLMYPYPVCTGWSLDTCGRQEAVTDQQAGITHRYVGVEG